MMKHLRYPFTAFTILADAIDSAWVALMGTAFVRWYLTALRRVLRIQSPHEVAVKPFLEGQREGYAWTEGRGREGEGRE